MQQNPAQKVKLPRLYDLDRYPWVVWVVLLIMPVIGRLPSLLMGVSTNPIWFQSAAVLDVGRQILPGWPFGDPNVGWTNQALGHLAAQDWLHGRLPWWNPYSGIGLPLAGEMQPAAFFLPFILLLHFQDGMAWLEGSLQVFAGLATYGLLRQLGMSRVSALVGAVLYQFNGTFAWVPNEANLNVLPFLPLLLLGIEYGRTAYGRRSIILVALAIGGSILAGFPEAAYINGVMALVWALYRLIGEPRRGIYSIRIILGGLFGLLLAAPLIIAFADFSRLTDIVQTHGLGEWSMPIRGLAGLIVPFVFGPLASNFDNGHLLTFASSTGGYLGAGLLLLALIGVTARNDRGINVVLAGWVVFSLAKTFGFLPVMMIVNSLPFMRDVMFCRYAGPSWELALVILVARALDERGVSSWRLATALGVTFATILLAVGLAWPWAAIWGWSALDRAILVRWLVRATGAEIVVLAALGLIWLRFRGETRQWLLSLGVVASVLGLYAIPQISGAKAGHVDQRAIGFLKRKLGLHRFYSLGPIEPNYSAYFGMQSLNYNYSPTPLNWSNYVTSQLMPSVDTQGGIVFWAPVSPSSHHQAVDDLLRLRAHYRRLAVKYIVGEPNMSLAPAVVVPDRGVYGGTYLLDHGKTLIVRERAPPGMARLPSVGKVGVFQGNFGDTADGTLEIQLCADGKCEAGRRKLVRSSDNSLFAVRLDHAVRIKPGEAIIVSLRQIGGNHRDAIWLWPGRRRGFHLATGSGRVIRDRTVRLSFAGVAGPRGFRRVYRDKLLSVWRLNRIDPFYTTSGAACTVDRAKFNEVSVACGGPAELLRRELFMAGWHASDNDAVVPIKVSRGVLQGIRLKRGDNRIRFVFEPPYVFYGWVGFWIAVFGLVFVAMAPER